MKSNLKVQRIACLPTVLINKIAAGEVIEAPYSVIKEVVENALDAGAQSIRIETRAAGMQQIRIEDNGCGIHKKDLKLSVERHATSKISSLDDLDSVLSFGFRGEALASIASVSRLTIQSKIIPNDSGYMLECRGGDILNLEEVVCKNGTKITIEELFYATPARRKYIKSERSENIRNAKEIQKIALAHPQKRFVYIRDGKEKFDFYKADNLLERITQVYNKQLQDNLLEIDYEENGMRLSGYISNEKYFRANRDGQYLYINSRPVEIKNFSWYIKKAYGELLAHKAQPMYFLFLELDPGRVDINVHPQKREVRLLDERLLHNLVMHALEPVLRPIDPLGFIFAQNKSGHVPLLSHSVENHTEPMFAKPFQSQTQWPVGNPELSSGIRSGSSDISGSINETNQNQYHHKKSAEEIRASFVPTRHFGTIFGTYILAQGEDGLYIVDQHTAHERVNYEKKRKELQEDKDSRQILLTPVVIELSGDEKEEILSRSVTLASCGFVVDDYGPCTIAIREVPTYIDPGSESSTLLHLMHRIAEGETGISLYDDYAALKSCKASIRKNDHVDGAVISSILMELASCENPSRCPHGRPTMIKITQNELDKMFHRV